MEKTIELDIPLLAPDIDDMQDGCLPQLEAALQNQRGILRAHIKENKQTSQLCLHYDPNLISLGTVQRIAREGGSRVTTRYRHETIPFMGMDAADAATGLTQSLEKLPGMLPASINSAAGLAFVGLDWAAVGAVARSTVLRQIARR